MTVFADNDQNRLTIRTTQRGFNMAEALLKRLDVPARQVLIQAVIAEVTLTESTEYGFSYAAQQQFNDYIISHSFIGATGSDSTNFPTPSTFQDGMALLFEKSDDKVGFLRAVAGDTNVRVLSAPHIMTRNGQQATINVGDEVPIITSDYSDISGTNTTDDDGTILRNIEYVDTGVILDVTPYITAGKNVKLEIEQEVSSAVQTETSNIDSPTIQNRKLTTTIVVPNRATALLGGLIRTQAEEEKTGIPLLMDIPGIGALFRSNSESQQRTELLVLISADVVDARTALNLLAEKYRNTLKEIAREYPMIR
jgi:general secretion pathway protein D